MQAKALADRYTKLKSQMDSIIREANEEMSSLRENLNSEEYHGESCIYMLTC